MAFRVEISPRAFTDLDEIARYIKQQGNLDHAEEWFNGIIAAIRTLEDLPDRCLVADESEDLKQEVHLLQYKTKGTDTSVPTAKNISKSW